MRVRFSIAVLLALLCTVAIAGAETVQRGPLRVSFEGNLFPRALPRTKLAPVKVSVATKIASSDPKKAQRLRSITIAINRHGIIDTKGLPICRLEDIQPATTEDALAICKRSLVGEGRFLANVLLKGQTPFPSNGKLYAFNGEANGRPAILAHVYGVKPAPASFTLVFALRHGPGTFGTVLEAPLPTLNAGAGYISGLSLNLGKTFVSHGKRHSYISASCPAPEGFPGAVFPFAKASLSFGKGERVSSTLARSCQVR